VKSNWRPAVPLPEPFYDRDGITLYQGDARAMPRGHTGSLWMERVLVVLASAGLLYLLAHGIRELSEGKVYAIFLVIGTLATVALALWLWRETRRE
jgi:hypothetical protein